MLHQPLRILAPNPSPLTGPGTNTFLIGREQIAVIDPGPDDPGHIARIAEAGRGNITHILITHSHLDHSAGAGRLSELTGAPVLAFGDATAGRSPVMQMLARGKGLGGGEGMDMGFHPDIRLADGETITTDEWQITAVHTPGHIGNHLSFQWHDMLFCGDIVLGWSSTIISPPDGDFLDYMRSLDKIAALEVRRLYPAHGDPVDDPGSRLRELAAHRRQRSAGILAALRESAGDADNLAGRIYDVPENLLPAASRNVLAHLVAMAGIGVVRYEGELTARTRFSAV